MALEAEAMATERRETAMTRCYYHDTEPCTCPQPAQEQGTWEVLPDGREVRVFTSKPEKPKVCGCSLSMTPHFAGSSCPQPERAGETPRCCGQDMVSVYKVPEEDSWQCAKCSVLKHYQKKSVTERVTHRVKGDDTSCGVLRNRKPGWETSCTSIEAYVTCPQCLALREGQEGKVPEPEDHCDVCGASETIRTRGKQLCRKCYLGGRDFRFRPEEGRACVSCGVRGTWMNSEGRTYCSTYCAYLSGDAQMECDECPSPHAFCDLLRHDVARCPHCNNCPKWQRLREEWWSRKALVRSVGQVQGKVPASPSAWTGPGCKGNVNCWRDLPCWVCRPILGLPEWP